MDECPNCTILTGKCLTCSGIGKIYNVIQNNDNLPDINSIVCDKCKGSGICQTCKGSGLIENNNDDDDNNFDIKNFLPIILF